MARTKNKDKEARTKQVQIVVPQHLSDAVRMKASTQNVSINEFANQAIHKYLSTGGENILADSNSRMILMMYPKEYNMLKETCVAQGISINQGINHALTTAITGEQTDNTRQLAVQYMSDTSHLRSQLSRIVSDCNNAFGGCQRKMQEIKKINNREMPIKKDKKTKTKYEKAAEKKEKDIEVEIKILEETIKELQEKINAINLEVPPSSENFQKVGDYEPKSVE